MMNWFNLYTFKAQQGPSISKASKKKTVRADASEENPEDYIDPETPSGDKKKLSQQMAKQFSPVAVEKSLVFLWVPFLLQHHLAQISLINTFISNLIPYL